MSETKVLNRPSNVVLLSQLNESIMQFDVSRNWVDHPKRHLGLTSFFLEMRQEIHGLDNAYKQIRHDRMRAQLIQDFWKEDAELREVELAYTNTQP